MKWLVEPIGMLVRNSVLLEEKREVQKMRFVQSCIGYLDHPCKNKPVETEKDHPRSFGTAVVGGG